MKLRKNALLITSLAFILMVAYSANVGIVKASPTKVSIKYFGSPQIFDTKMVPGTQFTINITVDYVEALWGYQFTLGFDPAILRGVSYQNGPFLATAGGKVLWLEGQGFDNTKGTLELFAAALYPKLKFPTGGGVLANITFEVVGYGKSPIKFKVDSGLANKTGGWRLGPEWKPIHLSEPIWDPIYSRWILLDHNPEAFVDGLFDNRPPMYVSPSRVIGLGTGESFSVNVSVTDMEDIHSWSFYLNWTAAILNLTSVTEGDFGGFLYEINNEAGYIHVGGSGEMSGSGAVANITFIVKGLGKSNLTLSESNVQMLDSQNKVVSIRTESGFFTNVVHDIAITDVKPFPTRVKAGSGETIFINVTVRNAGAFPETGVNVTAYYEMNKIDTQTGLSLDRGEAKTLTFAWNTTGISLGKYTVKAEVSPVVNETDTADNTFSYRGGWVTLFLRDIAVTGITAPVNKVYSGYNITITVVVKNEGTEIEDFNVTTYYNEHPIGVIEVNEMGYLETRTLRFIWDTTGVELGAYNITAVASPVPEEEDPDDNALLRTGKVEIIAAFQEEFPIELAALSVAAVVIVGSVVFFAKRRKPPEVEEEIPIEEL